jgi:hypothetical protein
MHSKRLFYSKEEAEAYRPEFEIKCCDQKYLNAAEPGTLEIEIVEYEFSGEDPNRRECVDRFYEFTGVIIGSQDEANLMQFVDWLRKRYH